MWRKKFQWDGGRIAKQVEEVCVGWSGLWFIYPLWCRVKWHLYRKYTGGTLVPVISGMKKIDHQGRWNKHEVVSCSLGANWNWPERRGERDEEGEMWRTVVPLLRSIMLFYFLLMWQEHVVNRSYCHIHSAPNNTALLMSLLKNNTCTACLLEAREC